MSGFSPVPSETATRVWASLRAYVDSNSQHAELRERLGLGLGVGRVRALLLLKSGPLTLSELAEAHHVDAPYATIVVDKLESLGLVERTPHPSDRRRKQVTLTTAGRKAVEQAERCFAAPPPSLADLSAADLAQLDSLLVRLTPRSDPCPATPPT